MNAKYICSVISTTALAALLPFISGCGDNKPKKLRLTPGKVYFSTTSTENKDTPSTRTVQPTATRQIPLLTKLRQQQEQQKEEELQRLQAIRAALRATEERAIRNNSMLEQEREKAYARKIALSLAKSRRDASKKALEDQLRDIYRITGTPLPQWLQRLSSDTAHTTQQSESITRPRTPAHSAYATLDAFVEDEWKTLAQEESKQAPIQFVYDVKSAYERVKQEYEKANKKIPGKVTRKFDVGGRAYNLTATLIRNGQQEDAHKVATDFENYFTKMERRWLNKSYTKQFNQSLYEDPSSKKKIKWEKLPITSLLYKHPELDPEKVKWYHVSVLAGVIPRAITYPFARLAKGPSLLNVPDNVVRDVTEHLLMISPEGERVARHPLQTLKDSPRKWLRVMATSAGIAYGSYALASGEGGAVVVNDQGNPVLGGGQTGSTGTQ